MAETVHEAARDVPVLEEVDVLVAGGGVAGVAAAVSAARAGAKTLLVERNGCLGGVATAGLMANIGSRFLTGPGEQTLFGFPSELVDRLVAVGAASPSWPRRVSGVVIDSERLKVILIEMCEEAGVQVLTHVPACRPIMEGSCVRGAFIEGKSGRQAIRAGATVDATGEADLAHQAGAECRFTEGTASLLFKLGNVDLDAFVEFLKQDPDGFPAGMDRVYDLDSFERTWREAGVLFFPHGGGSVLPIVQKAVADGRLLKEVGPAYDLDALGMYGLRGTDSIVINSNFYRIKDLDVRDLSVLEMHAQKMCYYVADFMIQTIPGFSRAYISHIGVDLGVRVSRYIVGRATLQHAAVEDAPGPTLCDDVVATPPVLATSGDRFFAPYTFDLPFGVTVPVGCENLLVGSAKSVSTRPAAIIRGMTSCMNCGQAVGVASAIAAREGVPSADAPIRTVQRELLGQGVLLGGPERLHQLGLA